MINRIIFILMLGITLLTHAQSSYTLEGKVADKNGNVIEDVSVSIVKLNKGTYTNSDGTYRIPSITSKTIEIILSKVGYHTLKETINLSSVTTKNFTMSLKTEQIDEVVINSKIGNQKNKMVATSNRLGVKAIDMPNSSDVMDNSLFEQQQVLSLGEAISNVSGVFQFNKGYGGTSETFGARGVSLRYLGFMFRDGIRFGTNQSLATPELQAFERVEVLKGGAAINFGYVSPGATINYVTKKPFFETKTEVSLRYGSYNHIKPAVDFNAKISDKFAFRLLSTADFAESFRETVKSRRYYNFIAFRYLASKNTTIDLNIDYLKDRRPPDFGLPLFDNLIITGFKDGVDKKGNPRKIPVYLNKTKTQKLYSGLTKELRNRFLGSSFNNRNSNQLNANFKVTTQLNPNWNLLIAGGTSISDFDYVRTGSGFYNQNFLEGNDIKIKRTLEKQEWEESGFGAKANLTGKFDLLGMKNKMSFSLDYDNRSQNTINYASVRGFDEVYLFKRVKERALINQNQTYLGEKDFQGFGVSLQNLLSITDNINLLASVRMDKINGGTKNTYLRDTRTRRGSFKKGQVTDKKFDDFAITPSVGITYKITENNAVFASFTNTFVPNSRFRLGEDDQILPSYFTNQFEVGTKNSFLDNKVTTNITYYIINANNYISSPDRPDRYVIGPGTEYKGLEFDVSAQPVRGFSLSANYSYIDAKYGKGGFFKAGTRPQQTPEHQLGFWSRYQFTNGTLKNFYMNFGGQYTSERLGNDYYRGITPYMQDAYTLLNAGIGYKQKNFDIGLKVSNLLDEFVFFSYRYGSVNPIEPRQFAITTRYKF